MIIYKVTNTINGKIYFGRTAFSLQKRKEQHIAHSYNKGNSYNCIFHKAIRKYTPDNFLWEEFETNINDYDYLRERESFNILKYDTFKPNGYNSIIEDGGGFYGKHHTNKAKEKIRKYHIGKLKPSIQIKRMVETRKNRENYNHTEKTKNKISNSLKGKDGYWKGKKHTDEYKQKMSESLKGKMVGDKNPM